MEPTNFNPPDPQNSLLPQQYYLFDCGSGNVGVGYFPYCGGVIVVLFDGTRADPFEDIDSNSFTLLLSLDAARKDWSSRVNGACDYGFVFVPRSGPFTHRETLIRSVLFGLALRFCKKQELDGAVSNRATVNHNTNTAHNPHKHNTQYALEA
jgi:hypothetical protein